MAPEGGAQPPSHGPVGTAETGAEQTEMPPPQDPAAGMSVGRMTRTCTVACFDLADFEALLYHRDPNQV